MKKFSAFLFILATLPMMAADLELIVPATSPGYVDADTIDIAGVADGDAIVLELWLRNLDFTLAGFEGELLYPTWLTLVDTNAINTPAAPYNTGLAATQELPADAAGTGTAITFRNDLGQARVGGIVTDPGQRPTTGDHLLATFRLVLGRDFDMSLVRRNLPTCTTAQDVIEFLACSTGATNCHLIANDSASAASVNYTQADLQVTIRDSGTAFYKGDVNGSNSLTFSDVSPALQCIFYGDSSLNPSCPLDSTNEDEWVRKLDTNCSGSVTVADLSPLLRRALGHNTRPATKKLNFNAVASEGTLDLAGGDNAAGVVGVTLAVNGLMKFGQPQLSEEGIADGWNIVSQFDAAANTYKYLLYHTGRENEPIPSVRIPYTSKNASVAVAGVESFATNGRNVGHMPSMNRMDLRND